jgi:hypothetical protein
MITLFAQPYDITASGFYFTKTSEFAMNAMNNRNSSGGIVEEYEIQFIDGEKIDAELAHAWSLNQGNFDAFLSAAEDWDEGDKLRVIIAVGECGYDLSDVIDDPDSIDIQITQIHSMRGLAIEIVDEGLMGKIPEYLKTYLDYDAIARDLEMDYTETIIAGETYIYRAD